MMKKILGVVILVIASNAAIACDICGSGVGGSYLGILPEFRKRFIGLRYQQNSLLNHLGAGGSRTYLTTTERFRVMELWGAINIGKKFRVAGFIPYNFIERKNENGTFSDRGAGDMSVIGYYQLLNTRTGWKEKLLVQNLWIGAGVKLPTGHYNPEDKNVLQSAQNTFQLGTASTDFSVHAMYDVRLQDFGINTNAGYKVNTANKYDYRYGNKFTLNTLAYYKIKVTKNITLAPNTGVLFETASKDWKTDNIKVWETGGRSLMGTAGLEINAGILSAGFNLQTPLSQQLGEGKVKANDRAMVHVSFSL